MQRRTDAIVLCSALLLLFGGTSTAFAEPTAQGRERALRPTDDRLEELVLAALAADPVVESFEIVVTASDGTVALNGAVDSEKERSRAETVASGIEGVTEVENRITVAQPLVTPDRSDTEIRRQILEDAAKLVPDARVEVHVDHGFATITGTVASVEERRRLTKMAFREGALLVENQLDVEPE